MTDSNEQHKFTILIVDDYPDNLTLMSALLKDKYKVKAANSGERCLTIAQSDMPPDLILLDIMMPQMDGYEVCLRLKLDPRTRDIPVIFLTAKSEVEDEQHGLELGAIDYITKPISPPILLVRVKNHLALKVATDILREKNYFLTKEVQKSYHEIMGIKTGVYVHEIDMEELNSVILCLSTLLADNDSKSISYLKKHEHLLNEAFHSDFTLLQDATRLDDFTHALSILKGAAAQWHITC